LSFKIFHPYNRRDPQCAVSHAGLPIKVVFVGGSVTWGHGPKSKSNAYVSQIYDWLQTTFNINQHKLLNHAVPAVSFQKSLSNFVIFRPFLLTVVELTTLTVDSSLAKKFLCVCLIAALTGMSCLQATSAFINPCVQDLVPQDADLIFLEFTFNDSERGTKNLEDPGM